MDCTTACTWTSLPNRILEICFLYPFERYSTMWKYFRGLWMQKAVLDFYSLSWHWWLKLHNFRWDGKSRLTPQSTMQKKLGHLLWSCRGQPVKQNKCNQWSYRVIHLFAQNQPWKALPKGRVSCMFGEKKGGPGQIVDWVHKCLLFSV